ncbi:MAG: DNA polymerase III subunit alpha, partial [Candidatus Sumerlaeota bacterium]
MAGSSFVHLHVHSQYSLLDGVSHFGPLFDRVKELGMDTIALTDHGNLFGAVAFFKAAQAAEIKPIIGCEVYLSPTEYTDRTTPEGKRTQQHLVLLAKDFQGYLNLCYLVSKGYLEGFYRRPRIDRNLLAEKSEGLVALSGCLSGVVADYLKDGREKDALQAAEEYKQIMGPDHFYIELMDHGMPEQKTVNAQLIEIAKKTGLPLVATNDSHYLRPQDAKTQDLLLAIGTGKTLADATRLRFDTEEFYLKSAAEMEGLFGEVDGALSNTLKIAEMCNPEIKFKQRLLPEFDCPGGMDPEKYLRQLVEDGLRERYGEMTEPIRKRYEDEMGIITEMGFVSYFLVVWDFVNYARRENIPTGCRGSGAGSIVAYALKITELDPIGSKLFFERFLNPERVSMPDFDIDICQARRGEVIEYVRNKYGDANVANIITFGKMKAKAAVRDVGRVMDLPLGLVDRVAKLIPDGPKVTLKKAFEESNDFKAIYDADPQVKDMIDRARRIEGTVRQPGMHAAGVVVCSKPLIEAVPLYRQSGQGEAITQYDMIEVEELGLLKIDFLGLKNLTMIAQCVQLIKEDHDVDIDWTEVGFDDDDAFALLQRGDGFGVFQVESSGMR